MVFRTRFGLIHNELPNLQRVSKSDQEYQHLDICIGPDYV